MFEEGVRDSESGMLQLVDESYGRSSQPNFNHLRNSLKFLYLSQDCLW